MQPLSREVRSEINKYEREEQQLAKQRKLMVIFKTWLTSLNFQHTHYLQYLLQQNIGSYNCLRFLRLQVALNSGFPFSHNSYKRLPHAAMKTCSLLLPNSLVPRPLPDFILQPCRKKILEWPGDEANYLTFAQLYRPLSEHMVTHHIGGRVPTIEVSTLADVGDMNIHCTAMFGKAR